MIRTPYFYKPFMLVSLLHIYALGVDTITWHNTQLIESVEKSRIEGAGHFRDQSLRKILTIKINCVQL